MKKKLFLPLILLLSCFHIKIFSSEQGPVIVYAPKLDDPLLRAVYYCNTEEALGILHHTILNNDQCKHAALYCAYYRALPEIMLLLLASGTRPLTTADLEWRITPEQEKDSTTNGGRNNFLCEHLAREWERIRQQFNITPEHCPSLEEIRQFVAQKQ
jgi:hypothetical protein